MHVHGSDTSADGPHAVQEPNQNGIPCPMCKFVLSQILVQLQDPNNQVHLPCWLHSHHPDCVSLFLYLRQAV